MNQVGLSVVCATEGGAAELRQGDKADLVPALRHQRGAERGDQERQILSRPPPAAGHGLPPGRLRVPHQERLRLGARPFRVRVVGD